MDGDGAFVDSAGTQQARLAVVKGMGAVGEMSHARGVAVRGAGVTGPRVCPLEKRHLVVDLSTGKSRPVVARTPILSSVTAPWQGISLEQHASGPVESLNFSVPRHVVLVQLKHTATCEFRNGTGGFHMVHLRPGQIAILPAMVPHSVRTSDSGEFLAVRLDPKLVFCAAHELISPNGIELRAVFGLDDPLLRGGALALKNEAESGFAGGRVYGETIAATMAVHLVRHYSQTKPLLETRHGGLAPHQIRKVVDFIQERLGSDISLASLAAVAGLSPFHFARSFKNATRLTPHQFLVRSRVERARELLLVDDVSIADVALKVGFCDQSHLAAHFKRRYGVTPRAFLQQNGARKNLL